MQHRSSLTAASLFAMQTWHDNCVTVEFLQQWGSFLYVNCNDGSLEQSSVNVPNQLLSPGRMQQSNVLQVNHQLAGQLEVWVAPGPRKNPHVACMMLYAACVQSG